MLDLRRNRRTREAALAKTPIGYYWAVHTELAPEILCIDDHMERLKVKL
jgi:hypothetical protein